jgi:glycerophosphoryl diester phosphodiesterase
MKKTTKTKIKIGALALAVLLTICIVIAGMVILPQLRPKGKRYQQTTEFKNRTESMQMIAHRGLSGLALENSVKAFEEAGKRTYYGIETDVQVTKDGEFIILHDENLLRITGQNINVAESTYSELRSLRFGDVYGNKEDKTYYLPSVEEYIAVCKTYEKQAILELKSDFSAELVAKLVEKIKALGYYENTTFISFSRENLIYLRGLYPNASAQYIVENCTQDDERFMIENKIDADLCWVSVTISRVRRLHKAGLKVNCWTVDGAACATLMEDYGVDQITTNILE